MTTGYFNDHRVFLIDCFEHGRQATSSRNDYWVKLSSAAPHSIFEFTKFLDL